ncbi:MAG TPA: hypothetical protein VMG36_01000 [Thermoplasmata archaeon]|nr:hypothetical protein [Thermoplasmata archaeon]
MSGDPPDEEPPAGDAEPPADEEYARAYTAGYEDGVRSALREVVQHAVRGHTPQEIRMLAEGRLVRLPQEVETKRKALLAPPQRTAWGSLRRAPPAAAPTRPWAPPVGGAPVRAKVARAQSVVVREPRPARALDLLRGSVADFAAVALVSLHPPELALPATVRRIDLAPGGGPGSGGEPVRLSELGGLLRDPLAAAGGCLVFWDSVEYYLNLEGPEMTTRFANWLTEQVRRSSSGVLVSYDPHSLDAKDAIRLERSFAQVL